jgi:hypothetical protein
LQAATILRYRHFLQKRKHPKHDNTQRHTSNKD